MKVETLTFSRVLRATPALVFRAWARASGLREWLCDGATIDARPGGRYVLWWNDGYLMAGAIRAIERERRIAFDWAGATDPAPTHVDVTLTAEGADVRVDVVHAGLKSGGRWRSFREQIHRGWEMGLENMQSILEVGDDLRLVRQPMLGIMVGEYSAEIAAQMGIAGVEGIRLDGTIHGMGAEVAGLRKDDVIVSVAGSAVSGWGSIGTVLQQYQAGESVSVQLYRGGARLDVPTVLSLRTMPFVPEDLADLVLRLRLQYDDAYSRVSRAFAGASASAARSRPAPDAWSALETVAHLIDTEREVQAALIDAIRDDERMGDDGANPTNVDAHLRALAAVHTRSASMLAALSAACDETIALVERLPDSLLQRRAAYRRLARNLLDLADHTNIHVAQIHDALALAQDGDDRARLRVTSRGRPPSVREPEPGAPSAGHSRLRFVGGL